MMARSVWNDPRDVSTMASAKPNLLGPLNSAAASPLYRQIYDRIRAAIAGGLLKPGDRVPSARALMKELGLARGTIETAYSLLTAEGYILVRGQAGTIVSPDLEPQALTLAPALPPVSRASAVSFRLAEVLRASRGVLPFR